MIHLVYAGYFVIPGPTRSVNDQWRKTKGVCIWHVYPCVTFNYVGYPLVIGLNMVLTFIATNRYLRLQHLEEMMGINPIRPPTMLRKCLLKHLQIDWYFIWEDRRKMKIQRKRPYLICSVCERYRLKDWMIVYRREWIDLV